MSLARIGLERISSTISHDVLNRNFDKVKQMAIDIGSTRSSLNGFVFSDVRTLTGDIFLMAPGALGHSVDSTGVGTLVAILVTSISPAGHWNFNWFPRATFADIVVNNSGVAQNITIQYIAVGTG